MISLLSQSVFLLGKCICLLSALVPLEELWAKLTFCSWSCFIPFSINSIKPSGNGNNLGFDVYNDPVYDWQPSHGDIFWEILSCLQEDSFALSW